ncbi:beta-N-acetylhexosaminidase [Nonomuraea sp. LP-02]|uniref:beta-N-acetylhexosaminidase n=1 Tax=Nonomuraea sp. LP-02 TaxID=3097960 RepID=UPI002E3003E6|nr:beta-N-acetylhexosaminidase [Nonomuraea sp. LP-02]MED7925848.1 beta-N-acetylhexosaminidase [Nonomuraea sp. LP-02]
MIPLVASARTDQGRFPLGAGTRVSGPHAGLVRDLLGLDARDAPDAHGEVVLSLVADPSLGAEGYTLTVTPDRAVIAAAGAAGLGWGVQTLRQLDTPGGVPCGTVRDVPRYAWRGVMIDVARWWRPVSFLRAYVDLLALHKFNVLHLHLTDDQGWRFEVRAHPRLTEVGARRAESPAGHAREGRSDGTPHSGFYTQQELRDLVEYAAARGVTVVPEIEFPGHSQAAIAACPWLGHPSAEPVTVRTTWGISSHVLNVSDRAAEFARDVLDELSDVFPSTYVHIGGDEVRGDAWATSPEAARRVASAGLGGPEALHGWWGRLLADHLRGLGRRAVAWDDMLDHDPPEDMVIMAWRGVDRIEAAARAGHDVIAAPHTHTYLDYAESDAPGEPVSISGPLPLETVYGFDAGDAVLGMQAQLWGEYLPTRERFDYNAFPRLCAVAEAAWSSGRDLGDFTRRLTAHLPLLDRLGVAYRRPYDQGAARVHL